MVHIITGLQGSGKTKQLIDSVHEALKNESGSMVCIEKGHTLRFDLDHRVRLVDAGEYMLGSYVFLKGFISGLHAGNFDITHIFIDSLCKIIPSEVNNDVEEFLDWLNSFSEKHSIKFTVTISADADLAQEGIRKFF